MGISVYHSLIMNNIMSIILLFSVSVITISGNPLGIDASNDEIIANLDLHQAVDKIDLNKDGFITVEESGDQIAGASSGRSRRQAFQDINPNECAYLCSSGACDCSGNACYCRNPGIMAG